MDSSPARKRITVKDLRKDSDTEYNFSLSNSDRIEDLYKTLTNKIGTTKFILCLANRAELTTELYKDLYSGSVINLYESVHQQLPGVVTYNVNIAPHPDTITKSGMYEYYDSRGIDSVVISIAELIDNSLAATKNNKDFRRIEIRYYDNRQTTTDSMLVILDNGHGMDKEQLTNWAKFKYSKFVRPKDLNTVPTADVSIADSGIAESSFSSADLPLRPRHESGPLPESDAYRPRYLDSEINYFGAGGKQAIFNIGDTTTMISMPSGANSSVEEVYELTLSKDRFDEDARTNPDKVYSAPLIHRNKGCVRQVGPKDSDEIEDRIVREMESEYKHFSICCIKNVFDRHYSQLRRADNTTNWTKSLARIYHYYIHGPNGNTGKEEALHPELKNIQIIVKIIDVKVKNGSLELVPKDQINLKDIVDDFESQLVRTAADTFEFEIEHFDKPSKIEAVIRYHPYLHDSETLPTIPDDQELGETASQFSVRTDTNFEDIEDLRRSVALKNRNRDVFECFWHGRLIPQDCINFEWNQYDPKRATKEMEECYSRLSGALFTNLCYKVSQNKQSFMDLRKMLAKKDCLTYYRTRNGIRVRTRIAFEAQFKDWLTECHQKYDKQVKYLEWVEELNRNEYPILYKRFPKTETLTHFKAIDWRNRKWSKGMKIMTKATKPTNIVGIIEKFLVPLKVSPNQEYTGSPGAIEISQIPSEIYGSREKASKVLTFTQINAEVNAQTIEEELNRLYDRLPKIIEISFPRTNSITAGEAIPAGRPIGDMSVVLKNSKGQELADRIPFENTHKKLSIQLEILKVEGKDTVLEVEYPIATYSKEWHSYWFLQNEDGIRKSGKYRIACVCLNSSMKSNGTFADGSALPSAEPIDFTVVAGPPKHFKIVEKRINALIGKGFDLSLELYDEFENVVKPNSLEGLAPVLTLNGFDVSFNKVEISYSKLVIRTVVVLGSLETIEMPDLKLGVSIPGLPYKQNLTIDLQIGNPAMICVAPEQLEFMNGSIPDFGALVYDRSDNDITFRKQIRVFCKISEKINASKITISNEYALIEGSYDNKRSLVLDKEIAIKASKTPIDLRRFLIRFYLKSDSFVYLEKEIVVKKSSKPAVIRLFFLNTVNGGSESIEIVNKKRLEFPVGSALSGVHFKAYDCEETEIDLSDKAFVGQTVFVSWVNKPVVITANGTLPQIIMHRDLSKVHHWLRWQQKRKDIEIEFSFYLEPYADSAQRMTIDANRHPLVFPIGEVVPNAINVSVVDTYNNIIRSADIMSRIVIQSNCQTIKVDEKSLKRVIPRTDSPVYNKTSYIFSNIKLLPNQTNESMIGQKRLEFTIRGIDAINDHLDVNVVNGSPHSLKLISTKSNCITITNNRRFQLQTQLIDAFNNPILRTKSTVRLVLGDNFMTKELTAEIDEKGIAFFNDFIHLDYDRKPKSKCEMSAELRQSLECCRTPCFGLNKIYAIVRNKQNIIKSDDLWLHILCDTNNPISMEIRAHGERDRNNHMLAVAKTDIMPSFTVRLLGEDELPVREFDKEKIEMKMICVNEPNLSVDFLSEPISPAIFRFRVNAPIPKWYRVKFICTGTKTIEKTFDRLINVVPGPPVRLVDRSQTQKDLIVVTNSGHIKRAIVSNDSPLCLDLVDEKNISIYENISDRELDSLPKYSGSLSAHIIRCNTNNNDSDDRHNVPELEGSDSTNRCHFPIKRGRVSINELYLKEHTRGLNGDYLVELKAKLNEKALAIKPFPIRIMFTDDTERQTELNVIKNELQVFTKQKTEIEDQLKAKKKSLDKQKDKYLKIRDKEKDLLKHLKDEKINGNIETDLSDEQKIQTKLTEYENRLNELQRNASNRVTRGVSISSPPDMDGVIGKIADFAYVLDDELALNLSYFMRNYMNGVVTTTSEVAASIRGKNDINLTLPLDRIQRETEILVELPHERHFRCLKYMSFARNLLMNEINEKFRKYDKDLKRVFTSLLCNTLIADNLEEGEDYRKKLISRAFRCPTIVTKNGIIFDNGFIDTSCPLEGNNLLVFQSPPNRELIKVQKVFDLLKQLMIAYKERIKESKFLDGIEEEYNEFRNQKQNHLNSLDTSITERRKSFQMLSQTNFDVMDDDSNHSYSRRDSVDESRRRRSTSSSRYSDSERNSKRPRRY